VDRQLRIAVATCRTLPAHERDDLPLLAALRERGMHVEQPSWDDGAVDWSGFDAVLIRTTWDYQDRHAQFVAWAERVASCTMLFNPGPLVGWNTHKQYLRELEQHGVPLAETVWFAAGHEHDLAAAVHARGIERGFLKPLVGANARNTLRFDVGNREELGRAQAHLSRMTAGADMMLQPYLASVEREGELSVIFFDGTFSHAVRKVPAAGDYRVQDDWGAHDEPVALEPEAFAVCEQTFSCMAACFQQRGWDIALPLLYARVDLLRDAAGRFVLNELEIVEPSLFFRHGPQAPQMLADALLRRLR
jgi:glutathione synthase/RimK-type ligase-like ATP-grasp enzyme